METPSKVVLGYYHNTIMGNMGIMGIIIIVIIGYYAMFVGGFLNSVHQSWGNSGLGTHCHDHQPCRNTTITMITIVITTIVIIIVVINIVITFLVPFSGADEKRRSSLSSFSLSP